MLPPKIMYQNFSILERFNSNVSLAFMMFTKSSLILSPTPLPRPQFNCFLMVLSASCTAPHPSILHAPNRQFFLQSESDHVSSLSHTFGQHPMVYRIKQTPEKYRLVLVTFLVVPTFFCDPKIQASDTLGAPSCSFLDAACFPGSHPGCPSAQKVHSHQAL